MFLDLDNFKFINDTFGYPADDQLLFGVTRRLSEALRASDLLCRLGGDEFALILEDRRPKRRRRDGAAPA